MCGELLNRKVVKIRKPRKCEGCFKRSPIGTPMERNTVVEDGIESYYLCLCCRVFFDIDPDVQSSLDYDGCLEYQHLPEFDNYAQFAEQWQAHFS